MSAMSAGSEVLQGNANGAKGWSDGTEATISYGNFAGRLCKDDRADG